jgi:hypothetical protein
MEEVGGHVGLAESPLPTLPEAGGVATGCAFDRSGLFAGGRTFELRLLDVGPQTLAEQVGARADQQAGEGERRDGADPFQVELRGPKRLAVFETNTIVAISLRRASPRCQEIHTY